MVGGQGTRAHSGPRETVWAFMVDAEFYFGKALETKGDRSYIKAFEGSGGRVSGHSKYVFLERGRGLLRNTMPS